jgi:hypothetical protein
MILGKISKSKDFPSYRSKNGNIVFRGLLTANKQGQDAYEAAVTAQGFTANRDEVTGKLIIPRVDPFIDGSDVLLTTKGNIVISNEGADEMEAVLNRAKRLGDTSLEQAIQTARANAIVAKAMGHGPKGNSYTPSSEPTDQGPANQDFSAPETDEEAIARELEEAKAAATASAAPAVVVGP